MLFHDALDPHRDLMSANPITKQLSERDIFSVASIEGGTAGKLFNSRGAGPISSKAGHVNYTILTFSVGNYGGIEWSI